MNFRIADTFTDSLAKLSGEEQKAVKTTAFDLQLNPTNPGMSFHKLDKARDKDFWSVRVSRDLRLIVHKTAGDLLLCYVDHHDEAYAWAERRKLSVHPTTGAAQLVEIRETVKEITVPRYIEASAPVPSQRLLFENLSDEDLLGYGVPEEWLDDARHATEESLFELADHLPREAAEALLELATGGTPTPPVKSSEKADPFAHPDAQRRFRVMTNAEELQQALDFPWEKWTVFLHPAQRDLVEREFNGPARVAGSAGTGKTIVALHRAAHLARRSLWSTVLLTTFSEPLARALQTCLHRLVGSQSSIAERVRVSALGTIAEEMYAARFGNPRLATDHEIRECLKTASAEGPAHRFTLQFLWTEWDEIVDAWQIRTREEYRDVPRLGRKTRVGEKQRELLWAIFQKVRADLEGEGLTTRADMLSRVAGAVEEEEAPPFDFVVVDEAQDLGVSEMRFLAALGGKRRESLFFTGDLGQRIFQTPFSWKALGVDVRGRSNTLRINYRTSHQIRAQADRLLPPELSDVDQNTESRKGTISVFNGPAPSLKTFDSLEEECSAIARWIEERIAEHVLPQEIAVFVRSKAEIPRARAAVEAAGLQFVELDENLETDTGKISISEMHLAKGLEFRAVVVMACDDEVIPLQQRIESVTDESDLEDVYNTERHLLYVACTRARDHLLITGVEPVSEFLDDLVG